MQIPEPRIVFERAPLSLSVAAGGVLRRAAAADIPREMSLIKVVVTAYRQAIAAASVAPPSSVLLLAEDAEVASLATPWFSQHGARVAVGSLSMTAFADALTRILEPTALLVSGRMRPAVSSHAASVAAISEDGGLEIRAATAMLQGMKASPAGEPLVIEEAPGKMAVFDADIATRRRLAKRWQALISDGKSHPDDPILSEEGWGVGALLLAPQAAEAHRTGAPLAITTREVLAMGAKEFPSGWADALGKHLFSWVDRPLAQATIAVPSLALAAELGVALRGQFGDSLRVQFGDLEMGWHPVMSSLNAIVGGICPHLILTLGDWPTVQCILLREPLRTI